MTPGGGVLCRRGQSVTAPGTGLSKHWERATEGERVMKSLGNERKGPGETEAWPI
jgi:hypothetical protein